MKVYHKITRLSDHFWFLVISILFARWVRVGFEPSSIFFLIDVRSQHKKIWRMLADFLRNLLTKCTLMLGLM